MTEQRQGGNIDALTEHEITDLMKLIEGGEVLPIQKVLAYNPEIFFSVVNKIQSLDNVSKEAFKDAVEKYVHELETIQTSNADDARVLKRQLVMAGVPTVLLGSWEVLKAMKADGFPYPYLAALGVITNSILFAVWTRDRIHTRQSETHDQYEDMKHRLYAALRPTGV